MNDLTSDSLSRLQVLEDDIRKAAEAIQQNGLAIGHALCEIRDRRLWAEEFESWNQYLQERAGELIAKSFSHAKSLINAAEVFKRIPEKIRPDGKPNLTASHLVELGRLAPIVGKSGERGAGKDYSRLRPQVMARVLEAATEIAGGDPTVKSVRQAVDRELGIDRKAEAAERKAMSDRIQERLQQNRVEWAQQEEEREIFVNYINEQAGLLYRMEITLRDVPAEVWVTLPESTRVAVDDFEARLEKLLSIVGQRNERTSLVYVQK